MSHMQISDGGMAMNMNAQHHMEHFDNVLNLNMTSDYHYGAEYWNGSYKNGSTPMKEMEGEGELGQLMFTSSWDSGNDESCWDESG
jgi:hypothetical protein